MGKMLYTRNSFTSTHELGEADVCFLGIPFDSTALAEGNQRFGPVLIRQALKTKISYLPEKGKNPLKVLKINDMGDLSWVPGSYEKSKERIKDTIQSAKNTNRNLFFVFLGGEHSITLPVVEELEPKTVIQLDAHLDEAKEYQGNEFAHNTWAHQAKKSGMEFIQIGCRSYTQNQSNKNDYLDIQKKIEKIKEAEEPLYLTIDLDFFDPAYAPDVGFPEENGLTPDQAFKIIDAVFKKDVIGMDVCELTSKELNNRTSHLSAKIILRALANLTDNL